MRTAVDRGSDQLRARGKNSVVVALTVGRLAGEAQVDVVAARAGIHRLHRAAERDDVGAARTGDGQGQAVGGEGSARDRQRHQFDGGDGAGVHVGAGAGDVQRVGVAAAVDGRRDGGAIDVDCVVAAARGDVGRRGAEGDAVAGRAGEDGQGRGQAAGIHRDGDDGRIGIERGNAGYAGIGVGQRHRLRPRATRVGEFQGFHVDNCGKTGVGKGCAVADAQGIG